MWHTDTQHYWTNKQQRSRGAVGNHWYGHHPVPVTDTVTTQSRSQVMLWHAAVSISRWILDVDYLVCGTGRWCWILWWKSRKEKHRYRKTCGTRYHQNPETTHTNTHTHNGITTDSLIPSFSKFLVVACTVRLTLLLSGSVLCPWGRGGVFNL